MRRCFSRPAAYLPAAVAGLLLAAALHAQRPDRPPPAALSGGLPVGTIVAFGGPAESVPEAEGWLLCDGRELTAAEAPALHAALGTAWGGRGETFRLPDLRGRFLRGVNGAPPDGDRDPDKDARTAPAPGGSVGNAVGSLQEDELRGHGHGLAGSPRPVGDGLPGTAQVLRLFATPGPDPAEPPVFSAHAVAPTAGGETRPKNAYVNWIIRAR
jgi:microcystin-dependent protein